MKEIILFILLMVFIVIGILFLANHFEKQYKYKGEHRVSSAYAGDIGLDILNELKELRKDLRKVEK